MGKKIEKTSNFFMDLFVEQKIPQIYSKILFQDQIIYSPDDNKSNTGTSLRNKVYSVTLIPEYLSFEIFNYKESSSTAKFYQQTNQGYAIKIKKDFDIDQFLKNRLKSNYRNVKKRQSRLEKCFKIEYKLFYGQITEDKCNQLMQRLYDLLVKRFEQRRDVNEKLKEWNEISNSTKRKIDEKKASLFVIYDDNVPINISLNYHTHNIMFGAISSYDIDYYKFGLGSLEKIKILEWCIENNYELLDFGYGDLDYKRTWSNYTYKFKFQVIPGSLSLQTLLLAKLELTKLIIKEYLKSKKIDQLYNRIKHLKNIGQSKTTKPKASEYELSSIAELTIDYSKVEKVGDDYFESSLPIKSIINNFIYATSTTRDSIELLRFLDEQNTFLIKAGKKSQKITF